MNKIGPIAWKSISVGLPDGRMAANDRKIELSEIQLLLEQPGVGLGLPGPLTRWLEEPKIG